MTEQQHIRKAQYYLDPMNDCGGVTEENVEKAKAHFLGAIAISINKKPSKGSARVLQATAELSRKRE